MEKTALPEVMSASKAKDNFFLLLDKVYDANCHYTLTKGGVPVAKVISIEEWQSLMTTLDILANKKHQGELDKRIKEVDEGKYSSYKEIFGHEQPNL